jgi:protoporphyrinogen oxidase
MDSLADVKIHIVGAGVSGLVAALQLEKEGFSPVIWEKNQEVGGRLQTEIIDNYQLDRGFQVLLDHYPMAQKYLDLEALQLRKFLPGAMIHQNQKRLKWGDLSRDLQFWNTPFQLSIAKPKDFWLLNQLRSDLKGKEFQSIFGQKPQSTLDYLKAYGFSEQLIEHFFKPFYRGIFLENELATSSRMFEFVFKMFAKGSACLPQEGIQAIALQLKAGLKRTTIHTGVKIDEIQHQKIIIEGVEELAAEYVIVATEASHLISNLSSEDEQAWNSSDNLYFEVEQKSFVEPLIGLLGDNDRLINNYHFPQSLKPAQKGAKELLSVTVVDRKGLSDTALHEQVEREVRQVLQLRPLRLIQHYRIKKALPKITNMQYDYSYTNSQLTPSIYLAGDQLLNPSLNAAMLSGERVAEAVSNRIKGIST